MFHYTDVYALRSILENKKIRMTDYRFLNDRDEYNKGITFICRAFKLFDEYPDKFPLEMRESVKTALDIFESQGLGGGYFERSIFVASFSKTKNSLSQWRNYGSYSIEFDVDNLRRERNHPEITATLDCYYYHSESDGVDHAVSIIKEKIIPSLMECNVDDLGFAVEFLILDLMISYALCFKDSSFEHENEVRIISLRFLSYFPDVFFRERQGALVPYVELDFDLTAIKGVMLGPSDNQESSLISLSMLILKLNSSGESKPFKITVDSSKLPYRG
ncbi:DUF2971 domain-containing protein (plasmid) [Raoultella planticola]|jgi:hypothetical protein|uniref:DUF2971 domain-containing protein n=2 Tax=Klebsiella TaxID=570 RepID=A0A2J4ZTN7_9ENTR|nr:MULTISPECIES: DUF2971 domain-containing protein [Klebsiella/Raoultella group]EKH5780712.1 DUF2971 domain-containing protein [Escherichia coli O157]PLM66389.1 DUF2971 domain-containing protein [Klebsiella michiganensis]SXE97054.1 Uncharacterised protein [Klebsiella variicola]HDT6019336.1 DUF2971 domain-containing protein [Raoultella ornithinolytica]MCS7493865.1 DUF2971 domain-containing protein [Raoultella planticola]